jgi:hypothetical protein
MGLNFNSFTDQHNSFWENLITDSQDLEQPLHYKKTFKNPVLTMEEIKSVFMGMGNDNSKNKTSLVRVYIDGLQSHEYQQKVSKLPPKLSESLEEWAYRIFEKNRFCIVVNGANRWSEALSIKIGKFITPLLKRYPIPQISIDVTVIIGNYIYTPFGIHIDPPNLRTLHLHLGPGKKEFILWDKESFQSLTGSEDSYYQPEQISGYRYLFEVSAQDTFLIPAKYYHVCKNGDFSVGVGLTLVKNTKEKLFLDAFTKDGLKDLAVHIKECDTGNFFSPELIQYQNISSEILPNVIFEPWLEKSIKNYIYKQDSNLGLRSCPLECSIPFTHFNQLKRRKVRLCYPYKIVTYPQEEMINIFVRQNHLQMKNITIIQELINFINEGQVIKISTLIQKYSNFTTEDTLLGILILFIRFRGIEIIM